MDEKKDMREIIEESMKSQQEFQDELEVEQERLESKSDIHKDRVELDEDGTIGRNQKVDGKGHENDTEKREFSDSAKYDAYQIKMTSFFSDSKVILTLLACFVVGAIVLVSIGIAVRKAKNPDKSAKATVAETVTETQATTEEETTLDALTMTVQLFSTDREKELIHEEVRKYITNNIQDRSLFAVEWMGDFPILMERVNACHYYFFIYDKNGIQIRELPIDWLPRREIDQRITADQNHLFISVKDDADTTGDAYNAYQYSLDGKQLHVERHRRNEDFTYRIDGTTYHDMTWVSSVEEYDAMLAEKAEAGEQQTGDGSSFYVEMHNLPTADEVREMRSQMINKVNEEISKGLEQETSTQAGSFKEDVTLENASQESTTKEDSGVTSYTTEPTTPWSEKFSNNLGFGSKN